MPGRHELATSRLSWLAIIPTCLAKIGIVVPARGDCGLGGNSASKARHGGRRRELNAVNQLKGQDRAPDVLDMGTAFAVKGAQQGIAVSLPAQPVLVAARRVS
jgi:hypothetical protein